MGVYELTQRELRSLRVALAARRSDLLRARAWATENEGAIARLEQKIAGLERELLKLSAA